MFYKAMLMQEQLWNTQSGNFKHFCKINTLIIIFWKAEEPFLNKLPHGVSNHNTHSQYPSDLGKWIQFSFWLLRKRNLCTWFDSFISLPLPSSLTHITLLPLLLPGSSSLVAHFKFPLSDSDVKKPRPGLLRNTAAHVYACILDVLKRKVAALWPAWRDLNTEYTQIITIT